MLTFIIFFPKKKHVFGITTKHVWFLDLALKNQVENPQLLSENMWALTEKNRNQIKFETASYMSHCLLRQFLQRGVYARDSTGDMRFIQG